MSKKPDLGALFGAEAVTTFMGIDQRTADSTQDASSALVGVPCASPYRSVGPYCQNAPHAIRAAAASLSSNVDRHNFDIGGPTFPLGSRRAVDCGDLPFDEHDAPANRANIRNVVSQILDADTVPIVVGGDDSIPIPMLQALEGRGNFTIIQIDAHIDWRESHMGEFYGLSSTMRRASEMTQIERIVQVGARGIGSGHTKDYEDALDWGVQFVTAHTLHQRGVESALDLIPDGSNIVLCVDVDGLDPSVVPGVIGRTPGGLTYYQTLDLIRGAAKKGRLAAIDFVEFMPEVDVDGLGALTVSRLIVTTMGIVARQDMNDHSF